MSSYSSFKNDLILFNSEEYLKILVDSNSFKYFNNFIKIYKDIESEDFKKPIFSQTNKYKKIPNHFKNYKYLKINRENDDIKNVWNAECPKEENDKIVVLINSYLNKITDDTYKKISNDFINELLLINNNNLFEILSKEIIDKCVFDNKYRNLYVNICNKIWTNKQIHFNMINIETKDNQYYWEFNNELNGPFTSDLYAKNDYFIKNNFKKYFLNYIQKMYKIKDIHLQGLNDEDFYIKKKKILLLVELVAIIYLEKYINFDILHILIINLLHLDNNNDPIQEIEYEALYQLMKLIKQSKSSFHDFQDYKYIFNEYIHSIHNILNNENISKRCNFFLTETIDYFNHFLNEINTKENISYKNIVKDNDSKNLFIENLKNNNFDKLFELYKKILEYDKFDVIYKVIDFYIEKEIDNKIFNFLNSIHDTNIINHVLDTFIKNIEDILLDVPNANIKLIHLINHLKSNNIKKINYIEILKNINNDSDED